MASTATTTPSANAFCRRRLLQDLKELQDSPYPGIALHFRDADLTKFCLVLSPENEPPLHITVTLPPERPLEPPELHMDSYVIHPNVFSDGEICVNVLRYHGYTPAYTLKGLFIQMLSFFISDKIEQYEGFSISKKAHLEFLEFLEKNEEHRQSLTSEEKYGSDEEDGQEDDSGEEDNNDGEARKNFCCELCDFGKPKTEDSKDENIVDSQSQDLSITLDQPNTTTSSGTNDGEALTLMKLPDDILLLFCDQLDDQDLFSAARAWNGFGGLMRRHNILRTRQLQCFVLKRGFQELELGIGVGIVEKQRSIQSEFEYLSRDAWATFGVDRSIHGLWFDHWLGLPISQKHWQRVRPHVDQSLKSIAHAAGIRGSSETVLYRFMNDIVVQLSTDAEKLDDSADIWAKIEAWENIHKSTLEHASERAVESYFQLFHLLVCLACERPDIVIQANDTVLNFVAGQNNKKHVPNLGHLLIMILISDVDLGDELKKAIIREAITRNVVWMLTPTPKGKGMPELSFMETSAISDYRLQKTFEAGKTSYRLLMFLNLMRKIVAQARTGVDKEGNAKRLTLAELRDHLFKRHGAPPNDAAASISQSIREMEKIDNFGDFVMNMGLPPPAKSMFTGFLRTCVRESMTRGYSKWGLGQDAALLMRIAKDPTVERPAGLQARPSACGSSFSFFPNSGGRGRK